MEKCLHVWKTNIVYIQGLGLQLGLLCNQNHAFFTGILSNCRKFIVLLESNSVSEVSEW